MFSRQFMTTVSDPSSLNAISSLVSAMGRNVIAILQMGWKHEVPSSPGTARISMLCVPL